MRVACLLLLSLLNSAADALTLARITPSGEDVPAGRQLVISFRESVVPLGRMERTAAELPITVEPALDCQWRWLDPSHLACELDEDKALKPATRYTLTIPAGPFEGQELDAPLRHGFTTERPALAWDAFKTWRSPTLPVVRLVFNQPVTQGSAAAHIVFQTAGERVAAALSADPDDGDTPLFLPIPGESAVLVTDGQPRRSADQPVTVQGEEARKVWLVEPVRELATDTAVSLRLEPGLRSAFGPELSAQESEVAAFQTFPEFRFLGLRCRALNGHELFLGPEDGAGRCNPRNAVALRFTAPVVLDEVKAAFTLQPDLAGGRRDYDPWANQYAWSRLGEPHQAGETYDVALPEYLKAYSDYRLALAATLRDEFGRTLPQAAEQRFATDHRPPELRLLHQVAVLEQHAASELPLVLTNLDRVDFHYTRRDAAGTATGQQASLAPPRVPDLAFLHPLGLRELLHGGSGVVSGELASEPATPHRPRIFAQVTPFQVHAKPAQFNTTVWVTEFATGQPVKNARVRVLSGRTGSLAIDEAPLAEAHTDARGLVTLPGMAQLDPELKHMQSWADKDPRLLVEVRRGEDLALLPLSRDYLLEVGNVTNYELYSYLRPEYGHLRAWGATAQGVYRLGDTVQFKFYVRNQSNRHWVPAPAGPYALTIVDPLGKTVHEQDELRLNAFGAYDGEFALPKTGAVGWYRFELKSAHSARSLEPLAVLVSDFTPAPFKVQTHLAGDRFAPGDALALDTTASLHSGGPYAEARTRQTGILRAREFQSPDQAARGFSFSNYDESGPGEQQLFNLEGVLGQDGTLENRVDLPDSPILYGRLSVESSVRDERGKAIAATAGADWAGRDCYVGLKLEQWLLREDEPATVQVLVADAAGKLQAGSAVEVLIEVEEVTAARVKGAGNAYLTEYNREWKPAGRCALVSADQPLPCRFTPERPGSYRITARVQDTKQRPHESRLSAWAEGKGRVLFAGEQDYSLKLLAESERVEVGKNARLLVQNPFERATALITVERYGVLKSWVREFTNSTEVVEIPVLPDYAPGFYVSVTLMSPRVAQALAPDGVDLGKPALRMGYREFSVAEPVKALEVLARTDQPVYKPGETVTLELKARAPTGAQEPVELAVAVLDEAVLDLIAKGTAAYDPYAGFNRLDGLDLQNYSLLMALVGQQKFPKKGASPGGDGGADLSLRSLFKFVSYWNPALATDRSGRARVSFTLPDNLTGWRVLVMAVTPNERMGLGQARFAVKQATELRPVMPNQVREGDGFTAGFTILNRTERERRLNVALRAEGPLAGGAATAEKTLVLPPFGKGRVELPLKTSGPGTIRFSATAGDGAERDGLSHEIPVLKSRTLQVAASYASTTDAPVSEKIQFPATMHTDTGGLTVSASASVLGNLDGAFAYLRDYPYQCWEQRLSQGVMAAQYGALKDYLDPAFRWDGAAALPPRLLQDAASFQAPNGGMVFFLAEDRYVSPYLSAYTALAFDWLRELGHAPPAPVEQALHRYLAEYLRRDASPDFYTEGMSATVRAVALAALARRGLATPEDLARYAGHVPRMSLFGQAHYLQAALSLAGPDAPEVKTSLDAILAHGHQSAGGFVLSEALDDGYARILDSGNRTHCALLTAASRLAQTPAGRALAGELPEQLSRTITAARGQRDRWENTQENLFCMQALTEYSRVYEAETPALTVKADLDGQSLGEGRLDGRRAPPLVFERAFAADDPGRAAELTVRREGQGRAYVATRLAYADKAVPAAGVNAGVELVREHSVERDGRWQLLASPMSLRRGELVRVDLYLRLPAARHFLVVDDPVPGGLETVNTQLATASTVDAAKGAFQAAGGSFWARYSDWREYGFAFWSFYHQELRHEAARFYSEYLPAGNYHLSYTAQAIAPGEFAWPAARAEEMYSPEVYGLSGPGQLVVRD